MQAAWILEQKKALCTFRCRGRFGIDTHLFRSLQRPRRRTAGERTMRWRGRVKRRNQAFRFGMAVRYIYVKTAADCGLTSGFILRCICLHLRLLPWEETIPTYL